MEKWKWDAAALHPLHLCNSQHMGELAHHYIHILEVCWELDGTVAAVKFRAPGVPDREGAQRWRAKLMVTHWLV